MKSLLVKLFLDKRNLFIIGLLLTLVLTYLEVSRDRYLNFMIFRDSTIDFWNHIVPYGYDWIKPRLDFFLYGPLFSVLFTPFAYLPEHVGPFVWNVVNFLLYFAAIFSLPDRFTDRQKCKTYLYTILILATTQLSFQYNVTVAAMFLFAFNLMERGRGFWAVLIMMISGFTKVYGLFQLGMLLFYPRFWRNLGYALAIGVVFFFAPLVSMPFSELIPYYKSWIASLSVHPATRPWETFFYIGLLFDHPPTWAKALQIGTLAALAVLLALNRRKYSDIGFRVQSLGILMGWVILFSNSAEKHTYVIALLGYMLWYWSIRRAMFDRILFWANFVVLTVIPVDLLCPVPVVWVVFDTWDLNLWLFLITWGRMIYKTMIVDSTRLGE